MNWYVLLAMVLCACGIGKVIVPLEQAIACTSVVQSDKGTCGAVAIDYRGRDYAITAAHCLSPDKEYVWVDGIPSHVLHVDAEQDLAIVEPVGAARCTVRLEAPILGERVLIYGHPMSLTDVATQGHVARESVYLDKQQAFVIDATAYFGNSGGGVWDMQGRLPGEVSKMPQNGVPALIFVTHPASMRKTLEAIK